jgi:hypothetical protein
VGFHHRIHVLTVRAACIGRHHHHAVMSCRRSTQRYDRSILDELAASSKRWMVNCNADFTTAGDHARATLSNMNPMSFRGGATCIMHESFAVRNNRYLGNYCTNCNGRWWGGPNEMLHSDSSTSASSCGGNFWSGSGTVGSEDNFGGYWSQSPYHPCSTSQYSITSWWFEN